MIRQTGFLALCVLIASCGQGNDQGANDSGIEQLARQYLFLELSMGHHDDNHVDAYFGPEEIGDDAENAGLALDDILAASTELAASLQSIDVTSDEMLRSRIEGLQSRLQALNTRIAINQGRIIPFDEETRLLFGTTAPKNSAAYFDAIILEIDAFLPGEQPLSARVDAFLADYTIPANKLSEVFDAAIAECRRRTLQFIELPDGENFTIEYVTDKPWSGYNWYQGGASSLIQINTELPSRINSAVRLGCHEGYPGHHVYNALLEQNLVHGKGWLEFTLYPLFSPQSLIAEGSANYGVNLAFPGDERVSFEKDVLFPIAGLDASTADRYYQLRALQEKLSYAGNEAARAYLGGEIDRDGAVQWLMKYSLMTEERAQQRTRFIDTYRSYVINYNHGKTMVADYVESGASTADGRWKKFEYMLSTSLLPVDLER